MLSLSWSSRGWSAVLILTFLQWRSSQSLLFCFLSETSEWCTLIGRDQLSFARTTQLNAPKAPSRALRYEEWKECLIFLIWDLEGTTLRRLTAGLTITLPGDPLRFAGHGRLDVPGCGDWEGVGAGGQGEVETGGGGECLHTVHAVGLPVMTRRLLRLEVVPTEPGVAGTAVGKEKDSQLEVAGPSYPSRPSSPGCWAGPGYFLIMSVLKEYDQNV